MTTLFTTGCDKTIVFDVPGNFPHVSNRIPDYPFYFVRAFSKRHDNAYSAAHATNVMLEGHMKSEPYTTQAPIIKGIMTLETDKLKASIFDDDTTLVVVALVIPRAYSLKRHDVSD